MCHAVLRLFVECDAIPGLLVTDLWQPSVRCDIALDPFDVSSATLRFDPGDVGSSISY